MRHSMSKDTAFNAETTPRHTFLCSDSQCLPPGDPRILCAKHGYPITGKSFIVISDHEKNARAHSWLMPIHLWFTCVLNHLGNKLVSSANKWKSKKLEQWWKSLMYNKKKIGPRTDPWGTPHEISTGIKVTPFTVTVCRRFAMSRMPQNSFNFF